MEAGMALPGTRPVSSGGSWDPDNPGIPPEAAWVSYREVEAEMGYRGDRPPEPIPPYRGPASRKQREEREETERYAAFMQITSPVKPKFIVTPLALLMGMLIGLALGMLISAYVRGNKGEQRSLVIPGVFKRAQAEAHWPKVTGVYGHWHSVEYISHYLDRDHCGHGCVITVQIRPEKVEAYHLPAWNDHQELRYLLGERDRDWILVEDHSGEFKQWSSGV